MELETDIETFAFYREVNPSVPRDTLSYERTKCMEVVKNESFSIRKKLHGWKKRRAHCCNYQYIKQGMNSCVNLESEG